jgi:hypothetical protein
MAPHLSWYDREMIGPADKVTWCKTWAEVLAELTSRHGAGAKVGVYPYAPLQMPATPVQASGQAKPAAAKEKVPAPAD